MTQTATTTTEKKCKMENCKRPYRAKGMCNVHYKKWRQGEMPKKPRYKTCGEEGCKAPTFKGGICQKHFEALAASKKGADAVVAPVETAAAPAEAAPAPAPAEETKA